MKIACVVPDHWLAEIQQKQILIEEMESIIFVPRPQKLSLVLIEKYTDLADSLIIISPPHRSPRSYVPAPVINHCLISVYPCDCHKQFLEFLFINLREDKTRSVILAEWEDHYEGLGKKMFNTLRTKNEKPVHYWPDSDYNREDLLEKFSEPSINTFYFGHGCSEGLLAYHGIFREDLSLLKKAYTFGLLAAFSCDTLKKPQRGQSFGVHIVTQKHAKAFLGSYHSVKTEYNTALANSVITLIKSADVVTLRDLVIQVDKMLIETNNRKAIKAWKTYRVIGFPEVVL